MSRRAAFILAMLALLAQPLRADQPDAAGLELFENKIRPVLVNHCYECHSAGAKEVRGGLLVDSRQGLHRGGDSGPAVVPGDVEQSLLIGALKHESFEMPPDGKLAAGIVADFIKWIELGAPDPRDGQAIAVQHEIDLEEGRKFWAFQPPRKHEPPEPADAAWPRGAIDRFVLARLEAKGLRPSPDAEPLALVRRLYFDLIGLPPQPEEVAEFLQDRSPRAVENLVDRLLASPHFGERWGRHWLDVARYADSTGGGRTRALENAWRYRDYVIRSLNDDKPYNRFLAEQIAGDLLPHDTPEQRADALTATGFLVLGPTNYETQDKDLLRMDVVDEQIDTLGKAVLGMTLGCARCHDHKFDPIPTRDYYALAGIFRSTKTLTPGNVSGFVQRPLPAAGDLKLALKQHEEAVKSLDQQLAQAKLELKELQGHGGTDPAGPLQLVGLVVDHAQAQLKGEWKPSTFHPLFVGESYLHDDNAGKGQKSVTFTPDIPQAGVYEVRVSSTPGTNRPAAVPIVVRHADGEEKVVIDQRRAGPIDKLFFPLGRFRFEKGRQGSVTISNEGTKGHVIADAAQFIPLALLDKTDAPASPPTRSVSEAAPEPDAERQRLAAEIKQAEARVKSLETELSALKKDAPAQPTVMAVVDEDQPGDWHVHIRGGIRNLGEKVPRGFLSVAMHGDPPQIATKESGRRELAEWISSSENPLTARVAANRAWHHLFGAGLVRTTDNFGLTGELPSHPELLDYLAVRLMEQRWSLKQLLREIVLSRAYQQSTQPNDAALAVDPENRLLWRMNRRRLDAEALRDAILLTSGQLDLAYGGPSLRPSEAKSAKLEYGYQFTTLRRSVYVPVFRNRLLELFEVFDFADPNLVVGRRTKTTLPTQALLLMNSPFVIDQSRAAAERLLALPEMSDAERIELAWRQALGRPPASAERDLALQYLADVQPQPSAEKQNEPQQRLAAWASTYQALFACIDFRYLD